MKSVLLYSGGVDSLCVASMLKMEPHRKKSGNDVSLLYIDLDTKTSEREKKVLAHQNVHRGKSDQIILHATRLEIDRFARPDGFIPLRNLLFAALPAMNPDVNEIMLGAVRGEWSRDKSKKFFKSTSKLFSYLLERDIKVHAPFSHLTKTELIKQALRGYYSPRLCDLEATVSCYADFEEEFVGCGKCNACFRRWIAMEENGIQEKYPIDMVHYWGPIIEQTAIKSLFSQPVSRWWDVGYNNVQTAKLFKKMAKRSL